jgi:hypothetical protein
MTHDPQHGFTHRDDERGAALILAIVFLFAFGMLFTALGGFATNSLHNTTNFRTQRTTLTNAETMATASMQYLRSSYGSSDAFYSQTPQYPCPGTSSNIPSSDPRISGNDPVQLTCVATVNTVLNSSSSRVVDFYACSGVSGASCVNAKAPVLLLHAEVIYDDYSTSGDRSCNSSTSTSCGTGMTITTWDIPLADT